MSVRKFCWFLSEAKVSKRDKEWFPRWLRRYMQTAASVDGNLSVTEAEVVQFSRSLRDNGTPAWQRLQAVRAVEAYRNLVLKSEQPCLRKMKQKLGRIAAQEDPSSRSGIRDERQLIGRIDTAEPAHLQQMRKELRLRHKANSNA